MVDSNSDALRSILDQKSSEMEVDFDDISIGNIGNHISLYIKAIDAIVDSLFSIDLLEVMYEALKNISADIGKISARMYRLRNLTLYETNDKKNFDDIQKALDYLQDAQDYLLLARRKEKDKSILIKDKEKGQEITFDDAIRHCRTQLIKTNDFLKPIDKRIKVDDSG
jgi:hypothetical protein